ncbi:thiamine/thiamine pyrophosphate ABC transporter permease ThiP [Defluviimonas sp. WL0002]|uniref:Thiamine/thiamine pyrophosphate ABC transporter permease ThiP n=2 Tax=Albidovulum marisflavi TaxID=2984159 RepID=A0ABT2Z8M8_9RHOB|nr:thiamine/thiamine pyrophosphate ABC transporter permease ThiP [Defluviimonas sp. WL0002]MCV2867106.1 thiamine/thiamine pyrophosphate ABC transporter permease ThiP [Defluviimonas sp. WL0002]
MLTLGTLVAVFLRADGVGALGPAEWAAIRFTIWQAFLSALFSCVLAIPVARALSRRSFPGRALLIALLGAPFILPVIVAVMGLLAVFGRAGMLNAGLVWLGLPPVSIYGLQGVVLAHVFFNLPLAVRLLLQSWVEIPAERFRLAASLGMGPAEIARYLERPMLRAALPGIFLAIFLICLTSFAVALTLGGGPRATTVELAIYQAFRFDFDLGRAALLGLVQVCLCLAASVLALAITNPSAFGAGLDRQVARWDAAGPWLKAQDVMALALTAVFLLLPLALITLRGLAALPGLPEAVWAAALRSLLVALGSAAVTISLALPLAMAISRASAGAASALETLAMIPLATSSLVLGTGLFLVLRHYADPATLALPVTAAANATLALPFATRILLPSARAVEADYGRLADSLDMTGIGRLRLLTFPRLVGPLRFSAGLAAALSMGDLGVITLFADPQTATLPLQLYRLMAAYRMEDAAGAAVLLLGLSFALFWIIDKGARPDARA